MGWILINSSVVNQNSLEPPKNVYWVDIILEIKGYRLIHTRIRIILRDMN